MKKEILKKLLDTDPHLAWGAFAEIKKGLPYPLNFLNDLIEQYFSLGSSLGKYPGRFFGVPTIHAKLIGFSGKAGFRAISQRLQENHSITQLMALYSLGFFRESQEEIIDLIVSTENLTDEWVVFQAIIACLSLFGPEDSVDPARSLVIFLDQKKTSPSILIQGTSQIAQRFILNQPLVLDNTVKEFTNYFELSNPTEQAKISEFFPLIGSYAAPFVERIGSAIKKAHQEHTLPCELVDNCALMISLHESINKVISLELQPTNPSFNSFVMLAGELGKGGVLLLPQLKTLRSAEETEELRQLLSYAIGRIEK